LETNLPEEIKKLGEMFTQGFEETKKMCSMVLVLLQKLDNNLAVNLVQEPPDELINIQEAANMMKVSVKTVDRRRLAGIISCTKILGTLYFSKNEVTALVCTMPKQK